MPQSSNRNHKGFRNFLAQLATILTVASCLAVVVRYPIALFGIFALDIPSQSVDQIILETLVWAASKVEFFVLAIFNGLQCLLFGCS